MLHTPEERDEHRGTESRFGSLDSAFYTTMFRDGVEMKCIFSTALTTCSKLGNHSQVHSLSWPTAFQVLDDIGTDALNQPLPTIQWPLSKVFETRRKAIRLQYKAMMPVFFRLAET